MKDSEFKRRAPPEMVRPDEVARNPGATRPVYNVDVAAWKLAMDWIERREPGVVVPMPTLPSIKSPFVGAAVVS